MRTPVCYPGKTLFLGFPWGPAQKLRNIRDIKNQKKNEVTQG